MHRFLEVFAAARGFKVTEIPTLHRPRTTGVSKYGLMRFFKGFLDLITVCTLTRFAWRPQHVIGVTAIGYAILYLFALLLRMPRLVALLLGLAPAVVLLAVGLTAELIVASRPPGDLYTVTERLGWCAQPADQRDQGPA